VRTLLYAMPSSGATYVAWTMAQKERTIGILDVCKGNAIQASECPHGLDVVVKDTAGGVKRRRYEKWLSVYKPDRVVLVIRDEKAIRESIIRRYRVARVPERFLFRGLNSVDELFKEMDAVLAAGVHDEVINYEDVAANDEPLHRSLFQIAVDNHLYCEWCRYNSRPQRWGFGGIHVPKSEEALLFHVIRYYGVVLCGSSRLRNQFVKAGMYVPPKARLK